MAYPSEIKSFTFKRNNIDKVVADDVNVLYTEVAAIEQQLGGVGSGGIGVTQSQWGQGTFNILTANWYTNDGLAARLKNIEAGLYATLVTGSASAAKLTTPITVNGTTGVDWSSSSYTFTAAAGTLTGTTLNSTVTASSLTSVGTLSSLTVAGGVSINASSGTSAPIKLSSGTNISSPQSGAIEYDGKVAYFTPDASAVGGRAGIRSTFFYKLATDRVVSNNTNTLRSIFGVGLPLAASTTYEVEMQLYLTWVPVGTGTSILSLSTDLVGQATYGLNGAARVTSVFLAGVISNIYTSTSTTSRTILINVQGLYQTSSAVTYTPQIQVDNGNGTVTLLAAYSYIKVTPIGSSSVTNVGAWA